MAIVTSLTHAKKILTKNGFNAEVSEIANDGSALFIRTGIHMDDIMIITARDISGNVVMSDELIWITNQAIEAAKK